MTEAYKPRRKKFNFGIFSIIVLILGLYYVIAESETGIQEFFYPPDYLTVDDLPTSTSSLQAVYDFEDKEQWWINWSDILADESGDTFTGDVTIDSNLNVTQNTSSKMFKANHDGGYCITGYEGTCMRYNRITAVWDWDVLGVDSFQAGPTSVLYQAKLTTTNKSSAFTSDRDADTGIGFDHLGAVHTTFGDKVQTIWKDGNSTQYGNFTATDTICDKNGCIGSGGGGSMDYTNLAMENETNNFSESQYFQKHVELIDVTGGGLGADTRLKVYHGNIQVKPNPNWGFWSRYLMGIVNSSDDFIGGMGGYGDSGVENDWLWFGYTPSDPFNEYGMRIAPDHQTILGETEESSISAGQYIDADVEIGNRDDFSSLFLNQECQGSTYDCGLLMYGDWDDTTKEYSTHLVSHGTWFQWGSYRSDMYLSITENNNVETPIYINATDVRMEELKTGDSSNSVGYVCIDSGGNLFINETGC